MTRRTSPTIVIAGHYGFGNFGDEVILSSMIHGLQTLNPEIRIVVTSGSPTDTEVEHRVRAVHWTSLDGITNAIEACQLLIVGGGGLFHDYWEIDPGATLTRHHSGLTFFCGLPLLAARLRTPTFIYGVGVGPLSSDEGKGLTKTACDMAILVTVRDEASAQLLLSIGVPEDKVRITADPAFDCTGARTLRSLPGLLVGAREEGEGPVVAVALRNWDIGVSPGAWEATVAAVLDEFLAAHGGRALFVPCQGTSGDPLGDRAVAERVRSRMARYPQTSITPDLIGRRELARAIEACDLLLGMRLHSLVVASMAGIPSVALAYDPKVEHSMHRLGLGEYSLELPGLDPHRLGERIASAYQNRVANEPHLKAAVDILSALAAENARLAIEAMEIVSKDGPQGLVPALSPLADVVVGQAHRLYEMESRVGSLEVRVSERDHTIQGLRGDVAQAIANGDETILRLEGRLAEKESELELILSSRHWKLMSRYWSARLAIATLAAPLKSIGRGLLPHSLRRRLVSLARQTGLTGGRGGDRTSTFVLPAGRGQVPRWARSYDLICFPIIDWDFRFQRPQQLATQFASAEHRCFNLALRFGGRSGFYTSRDVSNRVREIELPGRQGLNAYTDSLSDPDCAGMLEALGNLSHEEGIDDAVCLVQLPFWEPLAQAARERWGWKLVYDCMDEHSGFSTNSEEMLHTEGRLFESSDLVLTSSRLLTEKASLQSRNVLHLPNAADFEHFAPPSLARPPQDSEPPIVGYYGAISDWFDVDMVRQAAQMRPEWRFRLIGDTFGADVRGLRSLPNVELLGERPYAELPAHLHGFDVATIPFKLNALTRATNPVKFYEYLSAGKPVVAAPLPDLEPFQELYYPAANALEFVAQVEVALADRNPERENARVEFARANTWNARFQSLDRAIRLLYDRAVIVVVCRDNLELTRVCLESIWEKTSYPNFEVIVVDNGSHPEVVHELRAMAAKEVRLRIVENGENLGFARANNIGIEAAGDCGYIVLLNNDTVVSRGWLSRLIRHLDEPGIAMVGPVTNRVGNEAQVQVGYRSIAGMDRFAEDYTRAHAGRSFEIPMLAMFCVAMRRSLVDRIGPLDERFGIGLFEDDDFSLRVAHDGGRLVCAEDVFVHHWGQASFAALSPAEYDRLFEENRRKFEEKWRLSWEPHRHRTWR